LRSPETTHPKGISNDAPLKRGFTKQKLMAKRKKSKTYLAALEAILEILKS
jgi:hypothetical protein